MAFRGCFGKDKEIPSKLQHLPKLFLRFNIIVALSATYALQYFIIISLTAPFDNNVPGYRLTLHPETKQRFHRSKSSTAHGANQHHLPIILPVCNWPAILL
jgi:hypothetical protein